MTDPLDWTTRGRELSETLDSCHTIVVTGSDPVATAEVALGIGRAQASRRRVAIADLIGEAPPLQSLVSGDDMHGISDSFEFGISLNKIARAVPEAGELFVVPSGTSSIDYETMLAHPRWRRLIGGFREVGALLILAVPADAVNLAELVLATDGAVVVGDTVPADVPVAQTLAWLRVARRSSVASVPSDAPLAMVEAAREHPRRDGRRFFAGAAGLLLTLGFIGAAVWFAYRPFASAPKVRASAQPEASPLGEQLGTSPAVPAPDTVRPDSLTPFVSSSSATDSFPLLTPANATDSSTASAWAVILEPTRTKSGAILDLRTRFETVPVGTYGIDVRTRSFVLVSGAYRLRGSADSLLADLRNHKVLAPGFGSVTSLPFAFLVQADVPDAEVPVRLKRFAGSAHPVYALRQTNGVANLYFGAYESAQQAALAVPSVREAGLTPTLVYRIGRVF
ncbi:MAG: hypothetical protein M3Z05_00490 [Gemmatimonadota bacterium]|nr:hypothetical protein [Gemmatimonadota bacterium]